jgi:tRNA pseudouridine38-40 synthase
MVLQVSYDGRAGSGWQTQPGNLGLQDRLEDALRKIAGENVATICAGRTDAGVHAIAQVVHFDTHAQRPLEAWVRGVNSNLPAMISVLGACEVDSQFHARFGARRRRYHYLLYQARVRRPLLDGRASFVHQPIDVALMNEACRCLLGEQDFSSFRSSQCQAKSPIRVMQSIEFTQLGALISIEFVANAFLHHMIRNLVGALFQVGTRRKPVVWLAEVLQARDRRAGAATFAADGLYLSGVDYQENPGLNLWPEPPSGLIWS